MALFEQDFAAVVDHLALRGVADLQSLLALIDRSPIVVQECLDRIRIVRANEQALELLGASDIAELEREVSATFASGIDSLVQPLSLLWGGSSEPADLRLTTLLGDKREARGAWLVTGDPPHTRTALLAAIDVSERARAERELRESEARYRGVVEDQTEFIVRHLPDGTRTFVNDACARYFGQPVDELLRAPFCSAFAESDRADVRARLDELRPERPTHSREHGVRRDDGSVRWSEWRDRAFFDPGGGIVEFQSVGRDVTGRKGAEAALRSALDEVERLRDELRIDNRYLRDELRRRHNFGELIGESAAMRRVIGEVELVGPTHTTVLICGETGTGKELIAHALHDASGRRDRVLVKVNCSAVAAGLVESELFGHEEGAFTGAHQLRRGRFEVAHGGTLFLDEIGELSLDVQAKLLRVLQEQEFERVGSSEPMLVDVRILAATNRDLEAAVEQGTFRADLFYRLNVFPVHLPALRARKSDIPLLAQSFLQTMSRRLGKRLTGFTPETTSWMMSYEWPGNVRELRNFVERAAILASGPILSRPRAGIRRPEHVAESFTPDLATAEREHIERVLRRTGGVISGRAGAARVLGVPPSTLRSKMKRLGVSNQRSR